MKNKIENNKNTITNVKKKTDKKKKVLMIVSSINKGGGVQSKIIDIYRNIDKEKVQFDFLILSKSVDTYEEEIENYGGQVFYLGRVKEVGYIKFLKGLYKLIKEEKYSVIHSYLSIMDGMILLVGKLAKVKIRISHSRRTGMERKVSDIAFSFLSILIKLNATHLLACSKQAGNYLYKNQEFEVIPNGFDFEKFLNVKSKDIKKISKNIGVRQESLVLGHIGRFSTEKNHEFLLDIAHLLIRNNFKNFVFLLIGDGELKSDIKEKVIELGMSDYFSFVGNQSNVEEYLGIIDILIFPSLHEGFGNVAVEAQAAGKQVIASEHIPGEIDMGLDLVEFVSLNKIDKWIKLILEFENYQSANKKDDIRKSFINRGFALESLVNRYYEIYGVTKISK